MYRRSIFCISVGLYVYIWVGFDYIMMCNLNIFNLRHYTVCNAILNTSINILDNDCYQIFMLLMPKDRHR